MAKKRKKIRYTKKQLLDGLNRAVREMRGINKTVGCIWQVLMIAEHDYAKYPAVQADLRHVAGQALGSLKHE